MKTLDLSRNLSWMAARGFFSSVRDDRFREYFVYSRVLAARTGSGIDLLGEGVPV